MGGAISFTSIPTEQTTALTDVVLVVVAVFGTVRLSRFRESDPWKVAVWQWAFALLAVAAALGAVVHGLEMRESLRDLLWQPLFLSLGLVVALFVVAAVHDWRGRPTSRRLLPIMLLVGAGFFGLTRIATGTFLVFIVYEAVAMLMALVVYGSLAASGKLRGAAVVAVAIVLNIIAAGIQASGSVAVTVGVPFDHNGVFHIVQAVAVVVLVKGLEQGLTAHAELDA